MREKWRERERGMEEGRVRERLLKGGERGRDERVERAEGQRESEGGRVSER